MHTRSVTKIGYWPIGVTSAKRTRMAPIPRLHVITDERLQSRYSHVELARLAASNGADAIQYREKRPKTTREMVSIASAIVEVGRTTSTLAVVNDRVDVCLGSGARAVHLGSDDLQVSIGRRMLGEDAVIGGTANTFDQAMRVVDTPIDYLGVGPVFGTTSKTHPAPRMGLKELSRVCSASPKPIIAIGNIRPEHVIDVLDSGAWGIAVLSGIVLAPDIASATAEYRSTIDLWLDRSR